MMARAEVKLKGIRTVLLYCRAGTMDVVGRRLVYFNVETARRFSPVSAASPPHRSEIQSLQSIRCEMPPLFSTAPLVVSENVARFSVVTNRVFSASGFVWELLHFLVLDDLAEKRN